MRPRSEALLDTIAALATPLARSALAVVRVSGSNALRVLGAVVPGVASFEPRHARLVDFVETTGERIDRGLVDFLSGARILYRRRCRGAVRSRQPGPRRADSLRPVCRGSAGSQTGRVYRTRIAFWQDRPGRSRGDPRPDRIAHRRRHPREHATTRGAPLGEARENPRRPARGGVRPGGDDRLFRRCRREGSATHARATGRVATGAAAAGSHLRDRAASLGGMPRGDSGVAQRREIDALQRSGRQRPGDRDGDPGNHAGHGRGHDRRLGGARRPDRHGWTAPDRGRRGTAGSREGARSGRVRRCDSLRLRRRLRLVASKTPSP